MLTCNVVATETLADGLNREDLEAAIETNHEHPKYPIHRAGLGHTEQSWTDHGASSPHPE
jgi:hypothetical protein